jgi:hypothetical protein
MWSNIINVMYSIAFRFKEDNVLHVLYVKAMN